MLQCFIIQTQDKTSLKIPKSKEDKQCNVQ